MIEARRFDELPFTDVSPTGPDATFLPEQVERIVAIVSHIRANADAA